MLICPLRAQVQSPLHRYEDFVCLGKKCHLKDVEATCFAKAPSSVGNDDHARPFREESVRVIRGPARAEGREERALQSSGSGSSPGDMPTSLRFQSQLGTLLPSVDQ